MGKRRPQAIKTSAIALTTAERRLRILSARKEGKTYAQIGEELNISAPAVWVYVRDALLDFAREAKEATAELRQNEFVDLTILRDVFLTKAINEGDVEAGGLALRVSARRAKLMGLDSPTTTNINTTSAISFAIPGTREGMLAKIKEMLEQQQAGGEQRTIDVIPTPATNEDK